MYERLYEYTGLAAAMNMTVANLASAVRRLPDDHPGIPKLWHVASVLEARIYYDTGDGGRLDEAIMFGERGYGVVAETRRGDYLYEIVGSLARQYWGRWCLRGDEEDGDAMVKYVGEAVEILRQRGEMDMGYLGVALDLLTDGEVGVDLLTLAGRQRMDI